VTPTLQPHDSFFALRSLSSRASEIHFVDVDSPTGVDTVMVELTAFVQSCLEVISGDRAEITPLGADGRWSGVRVAVGDALLDTIERQTCPRLHDTLAGLIRSRYPGIDVVWSPR
jgi:hypothetical protein